MICLSRHDDRKVNLQPAQFLQRQSGVPDFCRPRSEMVRAQVWRERRRDQGKSQNREIPDKLRLALTICSGEQDRSWPLKLPKHAYRYDLVWPQRNLHRRILDRKLF
jgi:hypothetical protein